MNPYVFIVGCPRSGTTVFKRILNAHPELAIAPETHWIPNRLRAGRGIDSSGLVTGELVSELFDYFRFPRLRLTPEEVHAFVADGMTYAEFVTAIFDAYGAKRGKRLVGDKTPPYVREIRLLNTLWPEARFIHLIRDGRDVALSALDWRSQADRFRRRFSTWRDDPVSTAALWWRRLVSLGRDDGAALGSRLYLEVRYEDLLADPEAECRRVAAFLDLRFDPGMLRFHEGRTKDDVGLSSKERWLPLTAGLRNWRTEMAREDVERFEAAAGDLLDEVGYERSSGVLSARARAAAAETTRIVEPQLPTRGEIVVAGGPA